MSADVLVLCILVFILENRSKQVYPRKHLTQITRTLFCMILLPVWVETHAVLSWWAKSLSVFFIPDLLISLYLLYFRNNQAVVMLQQYISMVTNLHSVKQIHSQSNVLSKKYIFYRLDLSYSRGPYMLGIPNSLLFLAYYPFFFSLQITFTRFFSC